MPDPTLKTVSASQIAALFGESKWETPFTLYHRFKGIEADPAESNRMDWGKRMQPLLIQAAADDLALEVRPNEGDVYVTNDPLGCTRDAEIYDPSRGWGALETKCVFDYSQWMDRWGGGIPPRDVEIQLQCQIAVGNGQDPYTWGVIAVWVCGDMYYFDRTLEIDLANEMLQRAGEFLHAVKMEREPDPAGAVIEEPLIAKLYPVVEREAVVESDDLDLARDVAMYHWAKGQESMGKKTADQLRSKILGAAGSNGRLRVRGAWVNISKSETKEQVATEVGQVIRKAGIRTSLKISPIDGESLDPEPQEIVA